MHNEEIAEQKYLELKELQQQLEKIQEYREILQHQQQELETSINAIQELEKVAVHTELLMPIANGIFVKTELKDGTRLIVNVGSNITVEKTNEQVIELLQQQSRDIKEKIPRAQIVMRELKQEIKNNYEEMEKEIKEDKT